MDLDEILLNGEKWLSLKKIENLLSIPSSRLKSKISKSGENSLIAEFRKIKRNNRWYIPISELPLFQEESKIINSNEYYPINEAKKIIKGIYHNSPHCEQISNWICKGFMNGIAVRPKTCREAYIKKAWVNEFSKSKKYRIHEGIKMLGITKDVFYKRTRLPESSKQKIITEKFPSGTYYITEEEIKRVRKLDNEESIKVGDYVFAGAGHSGRVEKIIPCNLYNENLKLCEGCENKKRKRYVIFGKDYCRTIVEKL